MGHDLQLRVFSTGFGWKLVFGIFLWHWIYGYFLGTVYNPVPADESAGSRGSASAGPISYLGPTDPNVAG